MAISERSRALIKGNSELGSRVEEASQAVATVLGAAKRLPGPAREDDAHLHAVLLYSRITELFSGCVLLADNGEPTAIPIVLRSIYEALVDLDNLLHDANYVGHIQAANYRQSLKIIKSDALRAELAEKYQAEVNGFRKELDKLKAEGKGPLRIIDKCRMADRLPEYDSLYALFCLDAHNNGSALADHSLSELPDGTLQVSFFGEHDPLSVLRRLDLGLAFLLEAAQMMHDAFKVPAPEIDVLVARFDRERPRA